MGDEAKRFSIDDFGALAVTAASLFSPGQERRVMSGFHRINRVRRWRGMVNCNESPWVTFRHEIKLGKCKLIRRRGKPPLLVAVKSK